MAIPLKENATGRYYVDIHCINCSLCSQIAPQLFATNHEQGYEYVCRQPGTKEEDDLVAELIDICPASAIQENK
ncbi:MAG: ferredoxin [Proteobacteria bacterium]|nr:ferredoxin [Pseudomonadota bacterium]